MAAWWLDALAGEGVFSHCQNEGERSLSVPGSGGRHKVLLLRSGAEWEPLSLTCMREEEGESLLRPEWDGGDHSLLEPEHLPCPSPSLQHIHQPSPDHHPFSLAWATVFQLDSAPLFLQSSTHAAQVDFLKWRSDHSVQGICRLAGWNQHYDMTCQVLGNLDPTASSALSLHIQRVFRTNKQKSLPKREPTYTVAGNVNRCSTMESSLSFLKKLKIELHVIQEGFPRWP